MFYHFHMTTCCCIVFPLQSVLYLHNLIRPLISCIARMLIFILLINLIKYHHEPVTPEPHLFKLCS